MANIKPLSGKYYGTVIEFTGKDGQGQIVKIWTPNHFAIPFASVREIEAGWLPEDGHDHVEDAQSYEIAQITAKALSEHGY